MLTANLVVYENLSPSLTQIPQVPVGDWAFEAHNDFLAVWDEASHGILHVHPGDREVFSSLALGLCSSAMSFFGFVVPPKEARGAGPLGAEGEEGRGSGAMAAPGSPDEAAAPPCSSRATRKDRSS